MKRKIIEIEEDKCNGCGECIPNCPEGAIQIIDGKARLVSDLFCDGLGECLKHCPQDAISVIEREAEPYDEKKVMENIVKKGKNTIKAHLKHLKEHGQMKYFKEAEEYLEEKGIENPLKDEHQEGHVCPGAKMMEFEENDNTQPGRQKSELRQWPVQLQLVPPNAPYFKNSHLLIAADCVAYAYPNFHSDFMKDKSVVIACPKLDRTDNYVEKLSQIIYEGGIKKVTVVHMEVPCCEGIKHIAKEAASNSGEDVEVDSNMISIK